MMSTESGITIPLSEPHRPNKLFDSFFTPEGIFTDFKFRQSKKTPSPKTVTDSGITISVNDSHSLKAPLPIDVNAFGNFTSRKFIHLLNAMYGTYFIESGNSMDFRLRQDSKAFHPIEFTVLGISILYILGQWQNAFLPIV